MGDVIGSLLWKKFGFDRPSCKSATGMQTRIKVRSWRLWNPTICVSGATALVIDPNVRQLDDLEHVVALIGGSDKCYCLKRGDSLTIVFNHKQHPTGYAAVYLRVRGRFPWPVVYRVVLFPRHVEDRYKEHSVTVEVV